MIVAVVLAGGLSSRMGRDKAQLYCSKSNLTLLQSAEQLAALLSPAQVLLSSNQHSSGIKDVFPQCGPLSGIHASCIEIRKQYPEVDEVLFIPIDMPYLEVDDLSLLINAGQQAQRPCCYTRCYLPLYLPINTPTLEYLHNTLLSKGNYSLKKMLERLNGLQVKANKSQHLININEPHEWQDFELNSQQK